MAYGASPSRPRKKSPGGVLPQVQQNIQQDARNRMMDVLPEGGGVGGMLGAPELVLQGGGQAGLPSQLPMMPMRKWPPLPMPIQPEQLPSQLPFMPMKTFPPLTPAAPVGRWFQ